MKCWLPVCLAFAAAGSAVAADYRAPRTAAGDPELEGAWTTSTLTPFERPDELKALVLTEAEAAAFERKYRGKPPPIPDDALGAADSEWWETDVPLVRIRGQARSSWIVAPADGKTAYTAAAKAANMARRERSKTNFDHPEVRPDGERCLAPAAAPLEAGPYNNGFLLLQTPGAVVIHIEWMSELRIVRLDEDRGAKTAVRSRTGASSGWWEGETLVVRTTGFAPAVVRAPDGDPTADMLVIERFTRTSPAELHYSFLISNPSRYVQPLQGETVFSATSERLFEFACHEGNYALGNVLAGGRAQDVAAAAAKASGAGAASPP